MTSEEERYRDHAFLDGLGWTARDGHLFNDGFAAGLNYYRTFYDFDHDNWDKHEIESRNRQFAKIRLPGEDKCEDQFSRGWAAARTFIQEQF